MQTIGFHAHKLQAKVLKDENMVNCCSNLLPLFKLEG
jgi:hypothetical protein